MWLWRPIAGLTAFVALAYAGATLWQFPASTSLVFQKVREGDHAAMAAHVRAEPEVVSWRDSLGYTALHWAAATNDESAVRLLLRAGADPNARDGRGRTTLHIAAMSQNRAGGDTVMKLLIAANADVDARDEAGVTPRELAERMERSDLSRTLLAAGAAPPPRSSADAFADAQSADRAGHRHVAHARAKFARRQAIRVLYPIRPAGVGFSAAQRRQWVRGQGDRTISIDHPADEEAPGT